MSKFFFASFHISTGISSSLLKVKYAAFIYSFLQKKFLMLSVQIYEIFSKQVILASNHDYIQVHQYMNRNSL